MVSEAVNLKAPPRAVNDSAPPAKPKKLKKAKPSFSPSLAIIRTIAVGGMVVGATILAAGVYFYFAKSGLTVGQTLDNLVASLSLPSSVSNVTKGDTTGGLILIGVGFNALVAGSFLNIFCLNVKANRENAASSARMAEIMEQRTEGRR